MSRVNYFTVAVLVLLQFCLSACQNIGSSVDNWIDPPNTVTFDVTSNATGVLRVGDIIEFNCTAHNLTSSVATLEWKQVIGPAEYREIGGRSPLTWQKTITQADHGTQVFCGTSYTFQTPNQRYHELYAKSEYISLQVQGVSSPPLPPTTNGERVFITTRPSTTVSNVGDVLEYLCDVENAGFPAIEMIQVKGHLTRQLYFGYQAGIRWMRHNLTATDRGSSIMCQAWLLDSRYRSYVINSEPYTLNIN